MTAAAPVTRPHLPTPLEEAWIANRLEAPHLFLGVTTADIRKQRVRARIAELGAAELVAGKRDGQLETFRELFARLYGEPFLISPTT